MFRKSRSGNAVVALAGGLGLGALALSGCAQAIGGRASPTIMDASGSNSELLFDAPPVQAARALAPELPRWELARNDHLLGARAEPTQAQLAAYGDASPCLDSLRRFTIQARPEQLLYFRVGAVRQPSLRSCTGW